MLHNKGETCVSLGVRCDWKWPICALNFQKWSVVSDCFVFATAVKNIDWNYIPDPGKQEQLESPEEERKEPPQDSSSSDDLLVSRT
jgi:hypothetical protein